MAYRAVPPRPVRLNINGDVPTPFILPYTWYIRQRLFWQLPKVLLVTVTADGELDNTRYKAVANEDHQFGLRVSFNLTEALDKYTGYHLVKVAKVNHTELHFHLSKYKCPCHDGGGCGGACGRGTAGAGAAAGAAAAAAATGLPIRQACRKEPVAEVLSRRATPAGADLEGAVAEAVAAGELGRGAAGGDAAGMGPAGSGESTDTRGGAALAAGASGSGQQEGAGAPPAGGMALGSRPKHSKRRAEDNSDGEGGNSAASGSSGGSSSSESGSDDGDSSGSSSDSDDGGAVSPEPMRNNPFRQGGYCSCPCHVWQEHWPDPDDPRKHQDHQDQERAARRVNRAAFPRAHASARHADDSDADDNGGDEADEDWELQGESSGRGRKRAGSREPAGGAAQGARPARRPRMGSGGGARDGGVAMDSAGGGSDSHPHPQRAGSSGGGGGRAARGSSGGGAAGSAGGDDGGIGSGSQRPPLAEVMQHGNGPHLQGRGSGDSQAGKGRSRGQRAPSSETGGANGDDGEEQLQAAPRGGSRCGAGRGAAAAPRPPLPPSHAQQQQQQQLHMQQPQQQRRRPASQQEPELGQQQAALLEQCGLGPAVQQRLGMVQFQPAELGPGGQPPLLGRVVPVQLQQLAGGVRPELALVQLVCNGELVPGPFSCPVLWGAGPQPALQLPDAVQGMQLHFLGWAAQERDPDTLLLLTSIGDSPTRAAAAAGSAPAPAPGRAKRGSAGAAPGAAHYAALAEEPPVEEGGVLTGRSDVGITGDVLRDYVEHCGGIPRHMVVELDNQVVPKEYPILVLDDMSNPATEASIQPDRNGAEVLLRLHGVPPHLVGMILTGWGVTEQHGVSVLVLRAGRPPTPPPPQLPPLDVLSAQPLLAPALLPAQQGAWAGPGPLDAIAQLTALTMGMAAPVAAGGSAGMVRLASLPTPDLRLPPILLAPPENHRPPCRAAWEVKPLEFYTRLRRGEKIRDDRVPLDARLHREHLRGGWGLRRLFVERDGYVDICTAAWCVHITEEAKSAFVDNVPPHARNCYFLGWGLMPGRELVLRVSSKLSPECAPPNAPNAATMAVHQEALAMAAAAAGIAKYYEELRLLRAAQGRRTPANEEEEEQRAGGGGAGAVRVGMKRGHGVRQRNLVPMELMLEMAPSFPARLPIAAGRGGGSTGARGGARY
ncbi:hypothetical protein HXX76_011298 [Chlamydomonas incerta]|uniref:Uncharacterized protein n=1 Tax=Chlamydomonas incerta TaxID=51695 RepID=A0A835VTU7_CHLIN|nr:hypothetical protein HXX76_011298 [Chlamydomonas incerta]|eukprot:KAG2429057.1 hypothetical protein HXX76_011298 [Chlamydomonas incerta]